MNQNVTASFGLSVLTVLFFAVVLYQPDPPGSGPAVDPDQAHIAPQAVRAGETSPVRTEPEPAPVAVAAPEPPPPLPERAPPVADPETPPPPPPVAAARVPTRRTNPPTRPVSRRVAAPVPPPRREPRGMFTTARAGESLAEVAERVYGSPDQARALWEANRDVLDRPEGPLPAGMLLRTP